VTGSSFSYGTLPPLYSVTNPNTLTGEALDAQAPFSFYDFLKYSQQNLSPMQFNETYQSYLVTWGEFKNKTAAQTDQIIKDRYVELLKDISLNHLTYEEKRYISAADFEDPEDLDIIIPFYSKKLREICNFYTSKREKIKKRIDVVKQKGNKTSIEDTAYEAVTEYLYITDDEGLAQNYPAIQVDQIIQTARVEFEELYDLYSSYLDNSPSASYTDYDVKTPLRQLEYTANTNSIEADMFLNFDAAVKRYIFEHVNIYLREIYGNFTINYNIDAVDLNCRKNDKLYDFISQYKDEASKILNLKKQLIRKYTGSDFYYFTTGSTITTVTSGVLFKADTPSKNLINRHSPTTASVEETSKLGSIRQVGTFFRPEKNGLLYFTAPRNVYKLDQTKLEPNKTYIIPDPNLYGNTTGLTNTTDIEYPLKHISDFESNVYNASQYSAEGDIHTNPFNQGFYAYFSKNQLCDNIQTNLPGLSTNLTSVDSMGKCVQWSCDVFGNQYGLFKSAPQQALSDQRSTTAYQPLTAYSYYDGGVIKFNDGALLPDPVYADKSSWVYPNIFTSNYYYNALFDGGIGNIINGIMIRPLMARKVYDGLIYDLPPETQYKLILNPSNTTFSDGTQVIDCGMYTDIDVYEANFSYTYILSSIQYLDMDGGPLVVYTEVEFSHDTGKNLVINENIQGKKTIVTFPAVSSDDHGWLYVKNISTGIVDHLSAALSSVVVKYNTDVQHQLTHQIEDFNVYNDIVYFHTPDYFVIDRVDFNGSSITRKSYTNNYITINPLSSVANISSPFFFETRDYCLFCVISAVSSQHTHSLLQPTFYRVNYESAAMSKIEINEFDASMFINPLPVKFTKISKPIFTYNSRNDLYAITTSLFDSNNLSYTYQIIFFYDQQSVYIKGVKLVNMCESGYVHTINWYDVNNINMMDVNYVPYAQASITVNNNQGCIVIC
jgi:hypothetical protein